ncbi:hypothetical protein AB0J82_36485 [Asanoa sp. NPDC049518]|uniref:hypothetical protein n=1 Tax=unclassified Asanoa TaxID=2685164 RepID=UPI0034229489
MRRAIATLVLVSSVTFGAAACGSGGTALAAPTRAPAASASPSPSAARTSAPASAPASIDAATKNACQHAVKYSDKAAANVKSALDELKGLASIKHKNTDVKDRIAYLNKYDDNALKQWAYRLYDLSDVSTDAAIKTALADASRNVLLLTDGTTIDKALTTTAAARKTVRAACTG